MKQIVCLMGYEYKKMLKRKALCISFTGVLLLLLFSGSLAFAGDVYVEGEKVCTNAEYMEIEKNAAKTLEGQKMSPEFFQSYLEKNQEYENMTLGKEILPENYLKLQKEYMPSQLIAEWVIRATDKKSAAEKVYEDRNAAIMQTFSDKKLSSAEIKWHEKAMEKDDIFTYSYNEGYSRFFSLQASNLFFVAIVIVIGTAPLFAEEYSSKTAHLILSSRYGKKQMAVAKLLTGFSFAVLTSLVLFLTVLIEVLCLYGPGNPKASIQMLPYLVQSSYHMTIGEFLLLTFLCSILSECFLAIIVMFCSSKMTSAFGPVIIGLVLAMPSMFYTGSLQYLGKITMIINAFPVLFGNMETIVQDYLLQIGHVLLPSYIYVPILYLGLMTVLFFLTKRYFCRGLKYT